MNVTTGEVVKRGDNATTDDQPNKVKTNYINLRGDQAKPGFV